jgi:hypothetical protein
MRSKFFWLCVVIAFVLSKWYDPDGVFDNDFGAVALACMALIEITHFQSKKVMYFIWTGPIPYNEEMQRIRFSVFCLWLVIVLGCVFYLLKKLL